MENTKYGRRREGRWTPIRAKAQDTRANPNSWETHLVRKSWDIGLLRALSLRIMMMIVFIKNAFFKVFYFWERFLFSRGEIFYPTKAAKILLNLPNSCIKRLFSDGFIMATRPIKNYLMKSHSPQT